MFRTNINRILACVVLFGFVSFAALAGGGSSNGSEPLSDAREELAWFNTLSVVKISDLQTGDILIRKGYFARTPATKGQAFFKENKFPATINVSKISKPQYYNYAGTKHSAHALIYLGGGRIADAVTHPLDSDPKGKGGVYLRDLLTSFSNERFLVFRPTGLHKAERISGAIALAFKWGVPVGQNPKIGYSQIACAMSFFGDSTKFGKNAKGKIKDWVMGTKLPKGLMCSEFVAYCYQNSSWPIQLDSQYTAVIRLEEYLKKSAQNVLKANSGEPEHPQFALTGGLYIQAAGADILAYRAGNSRLSPLCMPMNTQNYNIAPSTMNILQNSAPITETPEEMQIQQSSYIPNQLKSDVNPDSE
ncbi:MAG: hypothetical protein HQM10_08110 [Candidatus Riflebacteria bacterium]|nr:hypothetical protein [Candidatus Riflebacteria bacterium]